MRLTRKTFLGDYALDVDNDESIEKAKNKAINKLGKLEDLEEKIGIDPLIVWKALDRNTTIYVKDGKSVVAIDSFIANTRYVSQSQLVICDDATGENMYLRLDKYGKWWALTEEELL